MHDERAVPGALVTGVRNPGIDALEQQVTVTAGHDGRANLILEPGDWYVSAKVPSRALYGWYGSNPVRVGAGEHVEITLPSVAAGAAAAVGAVPAGEESVAGEVVGAAGVGSGVTFYLDASTQFRGPGYLEARADEHGRFDVRVSPGRYWIVARRRAGLQPYGPLDVGDDFGYYPGNPLEIRAGERAVVQVPTVPVLKKSGWGGASALRTRVVGTVRDAAGRALPGFRAFLHAKPTMLGKPEFVSEPSGPDGSYTIWADREGVYYLGARAGIGQARSEGERLGRYPGAPDGAVVVKLDGTPLPALDVVLDDEAPR